MGRVRPRVEALAVTDGGFRTGLIVTMDLGDEADPTAGPSAAFAHHVDTVSLRTPPVVEIRSLAPDDDATAFRTPNEERITRYFTLKKNRETLNDPVGSILLKGGHIFLAYAGPEAVGCVALIPMRDGVYELFKMAVSPHLRGRGSVADCFSTPLRRPEASTPSLCCLAVIGASRMLFAYTNRSALVTRNLRLFRQCPIAVPMCSWRCRGGEMRNNSQCSRRSVSTLEPAIHHAGGERAEADANPQ